MGIVSYLSEKMNGIRNEVEEILNKVSMSLDTKYDGAGYEDWKAESVGKINESLTRIQNYCIQRDQRGEGIDGYSFYRDLTQINDNIYSIYSNLGESTKFSSLGKRLDSVNKELKSVYKRDPSPGKMNLNDKIKYAEYMTDCVDVQRVNYENALNKLSLAYKDFENNPTEKTMEAAERAGKTAIKVHSEYQDMKSKLSLFAVDIKNTRTNPFSRATVNNLLQNVYKRLKENPTQKQQNIKLEANGFAVRSEFLSQRLSETNIKVYNNLYFLNDIPEHNAAEYYHEDVKKLENMRNEVDDELQKIERQLMDATNGNLNLYELFNEYDQCKEEGTLVFNTNMASKYGESVALVASDVVDINRKYRSSFSIEQDVLQKISENDHEYSVKVETELLSNSIEKKLARSENRVMEICENLAGISDTLYTGSFSKESFIAKCDVNYAISLAKNNEPLGKGLELPNADKSSPEILQYFDRADEIKKVCDAIDTINEMVYSDLSDNYYKMSLMEATNIVISYLQENGHENVSYDSFYYDIPERYSQNEHQQDQSQEHGRTQKSKDEFELDEI